VGTDDEHGVKDAIVCWSCGALVALKVRTVGGKRVVVCACGKTNDLETPDALRPKR